MTDLFSHVYLFYSSDLVCQNFRLLDMRLVCFGVRECFLSLKPSVLRRHIGSPKPKDRVTPPDSIAAADPGLDSRRLEARGDLPEEGVVAGGEDLQSGR